MGLFTGHGPSGVFLILYFSSGLMQNRFPLKPAPALSLQEIPSDCPQLWGTTYGKGVLLVKSSDPSPAVYYFGQINWPLKLYHL